MFDPWSASASVLREKVIEHVFLADLSRSLLLDLKVPFEVLRAEFDANGYDLVVEACGVVRHIQLKAMRAGGKRAHVEVNTALAGKPSGCVIWIVVDPDTLQPGPFLWFGGEPGAPLTPLGDRVGRHSKANSLGFKAERSGMRVVPRSRFEVLATIADVARRLFVPDEMAILLKHLAARSDAPLPADAGSAWLADVRNGDFAALPLDMDWDRSAGLAHLIDGWTLAKDLGVADPYAFADEALEDARATGRWSGTPTRLWLSLFLEHRRWKQADQEPGVEPRALLDGLVASLVASLKDKGRSGA